MGDDMARPLNISTTKIDLGLLERAAKGGVDLGQIDLKLLRTIDGLENNNSEIDFFEYSVHTQNDTEAFKALYRQTRIIGRELEERNKHNIPSSINSGEACNSFMHAVNSRFVQAVDQGGLFYCREKDFSSVLSVMLTRSLVTRRSERRDPYTGLTVATLDTKVAFSAIDYLPRENQMEAYQLFYKSYNSNTALIHDTSFIEQLFTFDIKESKELLLEIMRNPSFDGRTSNKVFDHLVKHISKPEAQGLVKEMIKNDRLLAYHGTTVGASLFHILGDKHDSLFSNSDRGRILKNMDLKMPLDKFRAIYIALEDKTNFSDNDKATILYRKIKHENDRKKGYRRDGGESITHLVLLYYKKLPIIEQEIFKLNVFVKKTKLQHLRKWLDKPYFTPNHHAPSARE